MSVFVGLIALVVVCVILLFRYVAFRVFNRRIPDWQALTLDILAFFLVVLFFFLTSACSYRVMKVGEDGTYKRLCTKVVPMGYIIDPHVDTNVTAVQMANDVRRAFNFWNKELGKEFFRELKIYNPEGWVPGLVIVKLTDEADMNGRETLRGYTKFAGDCVSVYSSIGCALGAIMSISDTYYDENNPNKRGMTESIVRHEIGHLVGFTHDNDFTRLMHYRIDRDMQHPVGLSPLEKEVVECLLNENCDPRHYTWPIW